MPHASDYAQLGSIESTLRQAVTDGMLADADLATDQATILANLVTRNANIIAGARGDLYQRYLNLVQAIKLGVNLLGATIMITDTATIYAAIDGTWSPGFAV